MTEDSEYILEMQRASIKLSKMSKGYNWEIKLISKDGTITKEMSDKLEELNNDMINKYGEKI